MSNQAKMNAEKWVNILRNYKQMLELLKAVKEYIDDAPYDNCAEITVSDIKLVLENADWLGKLLSEGENTGSTEESLNKWFDNPRGKR